MREARIILPENDNDGKSLKAVHEALQDRLCDAFGRFTLTFGRGGWKNGAGLLFREPVCIYDIAIPTSFHASALRVIAEDVRKAARQEAVYIRLPDGSVNLVRE